MQPLNRIQRAIILVVAAEDEYLVVAEEAGRGLGSRLVEAVLELSRGARDLRVEPFIFADVVVLARRQLALVVGVIAAEGVYHVVEVDGGEEGFFGGHWGEGLDCFGIVHQIGVLVSIGTEDVDAVVVDVVDDGLVGRELVSILASRLPQVWIPILGCLKSLRVTAVTLILVVGLDFLLIDPDDVQVHFPDAVPAILVPENSQELVHIEMILLGIVFE